ncbi:MAG: hypothetical protein IKV67_11430 [Paludibacteraceae bacterium]|nr:hypothetical protein [Paludibacteraceae bacterium]
MEEIINDLVLGELKYHKNNFWVRPMDAPVLNSNGNLKLVVQDDNKEGILDVQRKAYKTYLQNEETYKGIVTDYLLEYYKWNYEYIAREVNGVDENDHKDVVTEKELYQFMTLWYLFICRDGSFGYAFGCCWDVENGLAVLLSENEPRVISRTQLKNLHKVNDPVLGLLVHDGKNEWNGLETNSFFGKPENLEIRLAGGVDEGITVAQQKAYSDYLSKKDNLFKDFTKMMLSVYSGSENQAENMLALGQPIVVSTCLPKTLYIDREGNYGWMCYTQWNDNYVDVLLSDEKPYVMRHWSLARMSKEHPVIDKEMGVFFNDYIGLESTIIVRIGAQVCTLPLSIEFFDKNKVINDKMREAYRKYVKLNETFWKELLEWFMDFYNDNYEELEERFEIPESLQKENINESSVMSLMRITKLYVTNRGRIAWLCEYPTESDGLAFEFTNGTICMIPQPQII